MHESVREMIKAAQTQLAASLEAARARSKHSGSRGDAVEAAVREFLQSHLPRAYSIGQGEAIDSHGNRSSQLDLVIANELQPFRFGPEEPGMYLIEGISAAGEIKTRLDGKELADALKKARAFKRLQAVIGQAMTYTSESDRPRFYDRRPFFLVAMETKLKVQTVLDRLQAHDAEHPEFPVGALDAVFLLDQGWLVNFGDGQGSLKYGKPGEAPHHGWNGSRTDKVLVELLGWLTATMPKMVEFVPAFIRYGMFTTS